MFKPAELHGPRDACCLLHSCRILYWTSGYLTAAARFSYNWDISCTLSISKTCCCYHNSVRIFAGDPHL